MNFLLSRKGSPCCYQDGCPRSFHPLSSNAIQIFWFIKKVYVLNDSMKLECIGNVSIYHEVLS